MEKKQILEIVYDGEHIGLNEEEAITLAQKGMNYDRLFEKYNEAVNKLDEMAAYKEKADELADKAGTTPENIFKLIENSLDDAEAENYSGETNIPKEYAEKILSMQREIDSLKKEKEELIPVKKRNDDLAEFERIYPDVNVRDIDREIIDKWSKSDKSLVDIYNSEMYKKLLSEKNAKDANEKNKSASCGSVSGSNSAEKQFTDEEIRKMSDEEISKNFRYLVKQLRKDEE